MSVGIVVAGLLRRRVEVMLRGQQSGLALLPVGETIKVEITFSEQAVFNGGLRPESDVGGMPRQRTLQSASNRSELTRDSG